MKTRPDCSRHRHAFTLLELLVVLAILGVLLGLLLPAVQKARDAAARIKCANNLHQIGLAAHQYHDTMGSLPPGMSTQFRYRFASWMTMLLPYIEQGNLWNTTVAAYQQSRSPFKNPPHIGLATVLPTFACSADPRTSTVQFATRDKFNVALTSYLGVEGQNLTSKDGLLFRDSAIRFADISDGLSNTLLAGERPASTDLQFGWWYAGVGQRYTGSAEMVLGVREQNVMLVTKGSCAPGTYSFTFCPHPPAAPVANPSLCPIEALQGRRRGNLNTPSLTLPALQLSLLTHFVSRLGLLCQFGGFCLPFR